MELTELQILVVARAAGHAAIGVFSDGALARIYAENLAFALNLPDGAIDAFTVTFWEGYCSSGSPRSTAHSRRSTPA